MKQLFLLLTLCFGLNYSISQNCPPTGFSDGTSLYFFYDTGTSLCADRPLTITIDGSIFTLTECDDLFSIYDLTSGTPVTNINFFTGDFGFGTCEYTNGVLTDEQLLSIAQFSSGPSNILMYPNPLNSGNLLYLKTPLASAIDINVYNISGKLVLQNNMQLSTNKSINLENLPNGVYLVNFNTNIFSITKKLVIMR